MEVISYFVLFIEKLHMSLISCLLKKIVFDFLINDTKISYFYSPEALEQMTVPFIPVANFAGKKVPSCARVRGLSPKVNYIQNWLGLILTCFLMVPTA